MKNRSDCSGGTAELTKLDRVLLHVRCLLRDHKYGWHLAGIWREVTLH